MKFQGSHRGPVAYETNVLPFLSTDYGVEQQQSGAEEWNITTF